jgi:type VI secretion system secreted protein VgrG
MRTTNTPTTPPSNKIIPKPPGTPSAVEGSKSIAAAVIDRVMKSEGASAVQSGKKEYFGFRSDHPAFGKIQGTVKQYGANSPQTRELVGGLLTQRAKTVGADKFNDAGVQGAILSIAHMRGEGGAQAVLNSVAGAPITKSGKLSNDTVNMINSMNPQEFQDKLRQVREQYDKQIYGNSKDSVVLNGRTVSGNWWDLFGKGLINRYNREQKEFLALSQPVTTPTIQVASSSRNIK